MRWAACALFPEAAQVSGPEGWGPGEAAVDGEGPGAPPRPPPAGARLGKVRLWASRRALGPAALATQPRHNLRPRPDGDAERGEGVGESEACASGGPLSQLAFIQGTEVRSEARPAGRRSPARNPLIPTCGRT